MIDYRRRDQLYSTMLVFIEKYKIRKLPIDVTELCRKMGVSLVPYSWLEQQTGLDAKTIISVMGNEDGAVMRYKGRYKIAYNDRQPFGRIRFTICEEISHIVMGHLETPGFNFFSQAYDDAVYQELEEEARLGAGMLVCPPRFYYTYEKNLTSRSLATACGITESCARHRMLILDKYRSDFKFNRLYTSSYLPWSQNRRAAGF